jgi:hypothetical protein
MVRWRYRISPETGRRIALRRVARGRITLVLPGLFTDQGRPLPAYVYPFLCDLFYDGHLRLGRPRPGGAIPVELSPAGEDLLATLGDPGYCTDL